MHLDGITIEPGCFSARDGNTSSHDHAGLIPWLADLRSPYRKRLVDVGPFASMPLHFEPTCYAISSLREAGYLARVTSTGLPFQTQDSIDHQIDRFSKCGLQNLSLVLDDSIGLQIGQSALVSLLNACDRAGLHFRFRLILRQSPPPVEFLAAMETVEAHFTWVAIDAEMTRPVRAWTPLDPPPAAASRKNLSLAIDAAGAALRYRASGEIMELRAASLWNLEPQMRKSA